MGVNRVDTKELLWVVFCINELCHSISARQLRNLIKLLTKKKEEKKGSG